MPLTETLVSLACEPLAWLSVAVSATVVYLLNFVWQIRSLPPGPLPLPIIGNIMQLRGPRPMFEKTVEMSRRYGDPFTLWLGPRPVVIAGTNDSFKDISGPLRNNLAGRMPSNLFAAMARDNVDVAFSDFSPEWDVLRRVCHVAIRKYAQTDRLGEVAHGQVDKALDALDFQKEGSTQQTNVDITRFITDIVFNILGTSCFGGFREENKADFETLQKLREMFTKELSSGLPSDIMPILGWIFYRLERKALTTIKNFQQVIDKMFAREAATFQSGSSRHFADALLNAREQAIAEDRGSAKHLTDANLQQAVFDIFGAGTGTTRSMLGFCLLYLASDADLQEELRQEVADVVGFERMCLNEDRDKLPKLRAFIAEMLRLHPAVPVSLPRKAMCDVTVNGRSIPKGTGMLINLFAVNRDSAVWGHDAQSFRADRFLSATKDQLSRGATSFGIGARSCPGERMALADFDYVLVRLLQQVRIAPQATRKLDLDFPDNDIFLDPVHQQLVFEKLDR